MDDSTVITILIGDRHYHTTARAAYYEMVLTWGCRCTVEQSIAYGMTEKDAGLFSEYAARRQRRRTG